MRAVKLSFAVVVKYHNGDPFQDYLSAVLRVCTITITYHHDFVLLSEITSVACDAVKFIGSKI